MDTLVLTVKDSSKTEFLIELIDQLDFVEVQSSVDMEKTTDPYDFFASAGLLKGRAIDANQLRKKAWKR